MGKDLNGREIGKGIIQKKNGRYEARYVNRFGDRKSITGSNVKDVRKRFNEAIYEDEKKMNIVDDTTTLNEWYSKWLTIYKYDIIREDTRINYIRMYKKHIEPYFGKNLLKDITQLQIRNRIKEMDEMGYGYEMKNKVKILLVDMFNKALIDQFVIKNPAKGITIKRDEEKDIKVLTRREQCDFFDCCKGTFYDNLFVVGVNTGLRIGEIASLKESDIDFSNGLLRVRRTLVYQKYENDNGKEFHIEKPKTKTSNRDIPINKQCEIALKKQIFQKRAVAGKSEKIISEEFRDFLFTTKYNTPLNSQIVVDAIKRIVNEVNLCKETLEEMDTFSFHCLRHTFATRAFESGIQPKTVQAYLGHATLQMTMDLYTSVLNEYGMSEMDKLQEEMNKFESLSDEYAEQNYRSSKCNNVFNFGDRMVVN